VVGVVEVGVSGSGRRVVGVGGRSSSRNPGRLSSSVRGRSHRGARSSGGRVSSVLLVEKTLVGTVRVFAGGEPETSVVEAGDGDNVDEAIDGLGEEVEDTVEDHLGGRSDEVTSISDTPGDRVKEPESREDDGRGEVGLGEVGTETSGRGATGNEEHIPDDDEGSATEGEESPLVDGLNKGTDKAGDDHDNIKEDKDEDLREGKTGSESEFEEEEGSSDGPVDVSSVPDGSSRVLNTNVDPVLSESSSTNVFDLDSGSSEVGSHSEVGNRSSEADSSGELVESTLTHGASEGESEKTDGGNEHDSEDSP